MAELLYLDLCCYKRPFDDRTDPRIRREADAVAELLEAAERGLIALVRSAALRLENDRNPREDRRLAAALWFDGAAVDVPLTEEVDRHAVRLVELGFGVMDALHLAFARQAGARRFVTCDDDLLALARRHAGEIGVEVLPPDRVALPERP